MKKNIMRSLLMVSALSIGFMGIPPVVNVFAQTTGDSSPTLDLALQTEAQDLLSRYTEEFKVNGGEVAILDPQTGKVLWEQNSSSDQSQPATTSIQTQQISSTDNTTNPAQNGRPFIFPTSGNITQGFHPGHPAIDIANESRPAVWAAAAGTVVKTNSGCASREYRCGGGYGNYVIIDHGDGLQTLYAHLTYSTVKMGQHVKQGEVIGKMGNTGNVRGVTGILLHFEVRKNGVKQLPSNYY